MGQTPIDAIHQRRRLEASNMYSYCSIGIIFQTFVSLRSLCVPSEFIRSFCTVPVPVPVPVPRLHAISRCEAIAKYVPSPRVHIWIHAHTYIILYICITCLRTDRLIGPPIHRHCFLRPRFPSLFQKSMQLKSASIAFLALPGFPERPVPFDVSLLPALLG